MHVNPATFRHVGRLPAYTQHASSHSTVDFFMNIIPSTVAGAFIRRHSFRSYSSLFFLVLPYKKMGGQKSQLFQLIDKTSKILFLIVGWIMKVAPIGAFRCNGFHDWQVWYFFPTSSGQTNGCFLLHLFHLHLRCSRSYLQKPRFLSY